MGTKTCPRSHIYELAELGHQPKLSGLEKTARLQEKGQSDYFPFFFLFLFFSFPSFLFSF